MRVAQTRNELTRVDVIANFLNFDFARVRLTTLKEDGPIVSLLLAITKRRSRKGLKEAREVQSELRQDLAIICTKPPDPPFDGYEQLKLLELASLVDKINGLKLQSRWVLALGGSDDFTLIEDGKPQQYVRFRTTNPFWGGIPNIPPPKKHIRVGENHQYVVYREASDESSLRNWLYSMVASLLEDAEQLNRLRMCPAKDCHRFFYASDLKKWFCDKKCKDNFNNGRRAENDYYKQWREQTRRPKVTKARGLIEQGKTFRKAAAEVGLSERILRREIGD